MLSVATAYVSLGGGYAECRNPATFTVEACTTVVEVAVVGLIGVGLTCSGVIGTIIGSLVRAGHLTPRQLESHLQVATVDEEKMFLATANQLLSEAKLQGLILWGQSDGRSTCLGTSAGSKERVF